MLGVARMAYDQVDRLHSEPDGRDGDAFCWQLGAIAQCQVRDCGAPFASQSERLLRIGQSVAKPVYPLGARLVCNGNECIVRSETSGCFQRQFKNWIGESLPRSTQRDLQRLTQSTGNTTFGNTDVKYLGRPRNNAGAPAASDTAAIALPQCEAGRLHPDRSQRSMAPPDGQRQTRWPRAAKYRERGRPFRYMFRRYSPPTSYSAWLICPRLCVLTASISASNTLRRSRAVRCR